MNKIAYALTFSASILALVAASLPAFASLDPVSVPEPGSLGLLTVGIGGAYLASKYLRRK